jgi:acyl-CoA thioesterase I
MVSSADGAVVARAVGVGPARVLLSWGVGAEAGSSGVLPRAYRIETSADSRDGVDGAWREELSVLDNTATARAHVVEFDGQSWVRMRIDPSSGGSLAGMQRFDVHDASDGTEDTWLVLGDGFAAAAFGLDRSSGASDPGEPSGPSGPSFAELVHESYPGYFPAVIGEGRRGESLTQTSERLAALLELHPHARHVVFLYGEAARGDEASVARVLMLMLRAARRVPVIARLPVSLVTRELQAQLPLVEGPDLEGWFHAHPEQLDNGGPTALGVAHIHRLLAEAMDVLYVPQ